MNTASDAVALTQLRARVDALAHRRLAAVERLAPFPQSPNRHRLEAMRFELAELEWQLMDLDEMRRA